MNRNKTFFRAAFYFCEIKRDFKKIFNFLVSDIFSKTGDKNRAAYLFIIRQSFKVAQDGGGADTVADEKRIFVRCADLLRKAGDPLILLGVIGIGESRNFYFKPPRFELSF